MKIKITVKDPDGVYCSVKDAVEESLEDLIGMSDEEIEGLVESRQEEQTDKLSKWIKYQEYIVIEFDTETMTARVIEN